MSVSTIDVHHHWMPKEHFDNLEHYLHPGERAVRDGEIVRIYKGETMVFALNGPALFLTERRLRDMDASDVDMAVLSTGLWHEWATIEMARAVNNGLADLQREHPNRIVGLVHVPAFGEGAIEELERGIRELDLRGVYMQVHSRGQYLHEKEYYPFYQKVAELGVPIVVHGNTLPADSRLCAYHESLVGFARTLDLSVAAVGLMASGILQELPNLRFVFAQFAGGLFAHTGRLAEARGNRPGIPPPTSPVLAGRLLFDTSPANWGQNEVTCAIENLGVDHIVFGSDYPIRPDLMLRARRLVDGMRTTSVEREKVCCGNAMSWFTHRLKEP